MDAGPGRRGLIVPAALVWQDYVIPGLMAGIVAVEIAHHHLDDQSSWLNRPARHLPDLYIKLGVQGVDLVTTGVALVGLLPDGQRDGNRSWPPSPRWR